MIRRLIKTAVWFSVLLMACQAQAGWHEFWDRVYVDWHRMNCWPEPFQHADKQVTIGPLIAMTDAGWRLQNTLNHHFFEMESQGLTQAGQLKVHWIATQAPMHRRAVFVLRSTDPKATMTRVDSVRSYLERILPDSPRPEVMLTDTIPPGGSGEYFDEVDRARKNSIPEPRLPDMESTSSSGS